MAIEQKPKKKQVQPKTHACKNREVAKARREKIIKGLVEGKTQEQVGIEAGLSPKTARGQVSMILMEPGVKKTFLELLHESVPDASQTNKYQELLEATKVISANVIAKNGEGMADANSMTKDFIEVPDYAVQLKANDSIAKMKGYVIDKQQHGLDDRVLSVLCSVLPEEYAAEFKKRLMELLSKK